MAVLENARHERFAQEVAGGAPYATAYVRAGFKFRYSNAQRLITNETVKARVAELCAGTAAKARVTLDSLVAECEQNYAVAMAAGQITAANQALALKARITGFWTADRLNDKTPLSDLPDDAVSADLARLRRLRSDHERATGTLQ